MVASLPAPVKQRLQHALAQWQHWTNAPASLPRVMNLLTAGVSNTSVQVGDDNNAWVIRLDGFDPKRLGLSRSAEWRALSQAAAQQLAPTPVYSNPELGILICVYYQPDTAPPAGYPLEDIAALLRAIHSLPPIKFRLDPQARARRYLHLIGDGELSSEFLLACDRLAQQATTPVLCHNDLLRANRLRSNNRLLALDWEYAAMGDPLFDLAVVIEGDALDETQASKLLGSWLNGPPTERDQQRLADNRLVYRELSELWASVTA
jgi:thiamine kinase